MLILNLIQNVALLVALAAAYQIIGSRFEKRNFAYQIVSGVLFGGVGLVGMMTPLNFMPGIIFDGRSIMLSVAGLFGGPVVAAIAASMCGAYRLWLGGAGALVGVAVIAESAGLGVLFHFLWRGRESRTIGNASLYLFGLLVHLVMLALMLTLPGGAGYDVLRRIGLPIMLVYPVAVMLVCRLFLDYERQIEDRKALRASEELFRKLFEKHSAVKLIIDPRTGDIVDANEAAEEFYGWSGGQLRSMKIHDINTLMPEQVAAELAKVVDRRGIRFEFRHQRADGSIRDVEVFSSKIEVKGRDLLHSIIHDVTDRKKAEHDLRESERRFSKAFKSNPSWLALIHMETRKILEVNDAWTRMIGHTREEAIGRTAVELGIFDEDVYRDIIEHLKAEGSVRNEETVARHSSGEDRVVLISREVVEIGGESYMLAMGLDITDRKRAEEALRSSEERFRILADGAFEGVLISREGVILDCNEVFCKMSGYSWEELIGMNLMETVVPEFKEIVLQHILSGSEEAYESAFIAKDGRVVPVQVKGKPLPYEGGTARIASIRDMSAVRKAEDTQKRLATAIEQAAEGILITDRDGLIQYANPAVERITGFSRDDLIGNTPRVFKSGQHDQAFYKELWGTITGGGTWSGRVVNKRKDGSLQHEEATISPVRDSAGRISNFVAVKRDISEHLELSKQLFQAQKMEAVGTLAGGIAHDFNNILQVALGYTELILGDEDFPQKYRADLKKINESASRGADLVRRLLTFSRKADINLQPLNLNRSINELRKMLERILPKLIEIEIILHKNLHTVHADATQIDQVLMNLAVNARDAMPDGGKLLIETSNIMLDDEYVKTHVEARHGAHVLLTVSDTGTGMNREALDHIFEPFYTTKAEGEGTGLGLAMVHGIVKNHGGHVRCYSEPGHGTTFRIYFPAEAPTEEIQGTKFIPLPKGGPETILLVDDEELIRDLGVRILKKAGYQVVTATNGREALEIYRDRESGKEIDLILLDLIMPEMGGRQCLEDLLRVDPHAKVVISSGLAAGAAAKETLSAGAKGFVNKPYDIRQVLRVVREVLDAERDA
ncbi:MAG: PAS domain S-box protein [Pseudomonadota bacterium]